jgi:hypothetical protein
LSDGTTHHGVSAYSAILDYLYFHRVSGVTFLKGIAGFGGDHHLHSSSFVEISDRPPLKIEFIETHEKVEQLKELAGSGLIDMQETVVVKPPQISKK